MKISREKLLSLVVPTNIELFDVNFTHLCDVVPSKDTTSGFVFEEIDWNIAEDTNWIYMFSAWKKNKFIRVIKIGETSGKLFAPSINNIGREYTSSVPTRLVRYTHDLHTTTVVNVANSINEQLNLGYDVRCHVVKPDYAFRVLFKDPETKLFRNREGIHVIYERSRLRYSTEYDVRTVRGKRIACEAELLRLHLEENNVRPLANKSCA